MNRVLQPETSVCVSWAHLHEGFETSTAAGGSSLYLCSTLCSRASLQGPFTELFIKQEQVHGNEYENAKYKHALFDKN